MIVQGREKEEMAEEVRGGETIGMNSDQQSESAETIIRGVREENGIN
jgi:hypothetical protein